MKPMTASAIAWLCPMLIGLAPGHGNLIRNGDFEQFTGNEPDGWTTTNIPKMLTVVSPSTKCHGGRYAVRCDVRDFYGSKVAGMIMQKNIALRGTALALSGFYAMTSVGKDMGFISLELQNDDGNTVKICQENLTNPSAGFTRFSISGDIPPGAVRLDIKLTLLPGPGSDKLHEGTFVLFDDLELVPAASGGAI